MLILLQVVMSHNRRIWELENSMLSPDFYAGKAFFFIQEYFEFEVLVSKVLTPLQKAKLINVL